MSPRKQIADHAKITDWICTLGKLFEWTCKNPQERLAGLCGLLVRGHVWFKGIVAKGTLNIKYFVFMLSIKRNDLQNKCLRQWDKLKTNLQT